MKPVANTSLNRFPEVGDRIRLKSRRCGSDQSDYMVVEIGLCDHRPACRQDDSCSYCLNLEHIGSGSRSHHCWNNVNRKAWWSIVG
jgi:hypothetical protein